MITSITLNDLYKRQISLIGKEAFDKINKAKVLVLGAGGLGCPALQYLLSSGVGKVGIVDFDVVSASNLQRQILFQVNDIGRKKVEVAKERLSALAPYCEIEIFPFRLGETNAEQIISSYDVILDCSDNFATKFLLHDTCLMTRKVFISASVYQYEGQLQLFDFRSAEGPCLRCLWTNEPQDGCTGTCAEVGVMGPLLGVMGSMQAMEVIKIIIDQQHLKNGEILFFDLQGPQMDLRRFKQKSDCPCCVKKEFAQRIPLQIDLPDNLKEFIILDVRSVGESENCSILKKVKKVQTVIQAPLETIPDFQPLIGQKYLVICARGVRSLRASQLLNNNNAEAYSLIGGIAALASEETT